MVRKKGKADISFFKNKIFKQDVLKLLKRLPDKSVEMVYGDADYNVGIGYHGRRFRKKFDEYIEWYIELNRESLRVLKDEGNLMMINYPKPNAHLRIKFLEENTFSVHEYVWTYNTNIGLTKKYFTSAHRSILHAVKMKDNNFFKKNVAEPYLNPGPVRQKNMKKIMENNPDLSEDEAEELFEKVYNGRMPYSWISEPLVKNVSDEKTIHPCQIPKNVSRKLIHACTEPEDTILVLFGGSGSECEVCKEGGRNFITTEIHEKYNRMIKERIKQGKIPDRYRHHLRKNY